MSKRLFDLLFAIAALVITLPILLPACFLIWLQDGHWPLYAGLRVGRHGRDFRMVKLRTMIAGGDRLGGSSTAISDSRLTPFGAVLRRYKIDELPQFWNVLTGDMSVVGPRPNVRCGGVDRYTSEELKLLSLRPGITDVASIVFADEGEILEGSADPDALYDRVIRPWKNRLGLIYVERADFVVDLELVALTLLAMFSRRAALNGVGDLLRQWGAPSSLRAICTRSEPLPAGKPPGQLACP
jgi:lipopolysaccharide/colanic/teichoic acid biosynthesis glycosyltransferase